MSPSPRIYTLLYLCVYTHINTHTYTLILPETLSLSKAQQTVKGKTEWKGGENKKIDGNAQFFQRERWSDSWRAEKHSKNCQKSQTFTKAYNLTMKQWSLNDVCRDLHDGEFTGLMCS